jgi:hypothetical protein
MEGKGVKKSFLNAALLRLSASTALTEALQSGLQLMSRKLGVPSMAPAALPVPRSPRSFPGVDHRVQQ